MNCYIAPSIYPSFLINISCLEKELFSYCSRNNYSIYDFASEYILKGWHIMIDNDYVELAVAIDSASIEFSSSSKLLLAQFSFFIWTKYPNVSDIHLISGDLSKNYSLQKESTLAEISKFLA